jgi:hypothetical protein
MATRCTVAVELMACPMACVLAPMSAVSTAASSWKLDDRFEGRHSVLITPGMTFVTFQLPIAIQSTKVPRDRARPYVGNTGPLTAATHIRGACHKLGRNEASDLRNSVRTARFSMLARPRETAPANAPIPAR